MVNDELRVAGATYASYNFWPGPISEPGKPPTDCASFDKIWTINRYLDVSNSELGEVASAVELSWPSHLGALYHDIDGQAGYDPRAGDKPMFFGDEMHWWVMNDAGIVKERSQSKPLGIEVRVSAFAFDTIQDLDNVTFYRYEVFNKNTVPIRDIWIGKFQDVDLGAAFDDFVGTDTTLSLVYGYNADNDDDGNYGLAPPAIGVATIEASHSKDGLPSNRESDAGDFLTNSMYYSGGGGNQGDPSIALEISQYLQSIWKTGRPLTIGGRGLDFSFNKTKYMFPGDPVKGEFWSEVNADNMGNANFSADMRMIGSYGPFDLDPGDSATFTYAYIWARGSSNLDSVTKLKALTKKIQKARESILEPQTHWEKGRFVDANSPERPQESFWLDPVFPNPSNGPTTVKYSLSLDGDTEIAVYDVLARKVEALHAGPQPAGPHEASIDTSRLRPGVYIIRLQSNGYSTTRQLTIVR